MPRMESEARSGTARVMGILSIIGAARRPLNLSTIATAAELPLATTHRYIRQLVEVGALEAVEDRQYRLGQQIWLLGAASHWEQEIRKVCAPVIDHLSRVTRHAIALNTLSGDRLICVDRRVGSSADVDLCDVGESPPLLSSSAGKVLLAHLQSDQMRYFLESHEYHGRFPESVPMSIAKARSAGYSLTVGEIFPHQAVLSVRVPTLMGGDEIALSLLLPRGTDGSAETRHSYEKFVPALRGAADALSRAIRHRGAASDSPKYSVSKVLQ